VLVQRLSIIGVGLIGGSFACALREAGEVGEVVGCGRNVAQLEKARELGVIDRFETDPGCAVVGADVVLLAVPLGAMQSVMASMAAHLQKEVLLTDVGSAKGCVVTAAQQVFSTLPGGFVPAHPIAGTEKSGVEAAFAQLFQQRRVIITPTPQSSPQAVKKLRALWQACGADVVEMAVQHHDEILAATSHLPHMLAYALVDTLARREDKQEIFDYAAGGFRDFTRIASSNPEMWRDICLANRDALVKMLQAFSDDLGQLATAVKNADSQFLKETFERAKQARDAYCDKHESCDSK